MSQNQIINLNKKSEINSLLAHIQKLFSSTQQEIYINRPEISTLDKEKIIKMFPLIKIFLDNLPKKSSIESTSYKKIFSKEFYPTLNQPIQTGGHLYNNALNIIYLTH